MSAPDGFTWETRNVGRHNLEPHRFLLDGPLVQVCRVCQASSDDRKAPLRCPSVQERRLVGPWEPVSQGKDAEE